MVRIGVSAVMRVFRSCPESCVRAGRRSEGNELYPRKEHTIPKDLSIPLMATSEKSQLGRFVALESPDTSLRQRLAPRLAVLCGQWWPSRNTATWDASGHKYMGFLMSFLIVTRLKIVYDSYILAGGYLQSAYQVCRSVVQYTCLLTGKHWRQNVAYAAILLLCVTMAVVQLRTTDQSPSDVPEFDAEYNEDVRRWSFLWDQSPRHLSHASPVAYSSHKGIMSQRTEPILQAGTFQHPCHEELKLLDFVGDFLRAYEGLKNYISTPVPFPLVQMSKTFLFVWVFTLPLALCHDHYDHDS